MIQKNMNETKNKQTQCNSDACSQRICSPSKSLSTPGCLFNVTYGDGSHISGFTVVDNISFVWEQVKKKHE